MVPAPAKLKIVGVRQYEVTSACLSPMSVKLQTLRVSFMPNSGI